MTVPAVQTIRMTPPQTVSAFAVSTGAVEVDIVSTIASAAPSLGVSGVTYGLVVTPSWVTTWWLADETATTWSINFSVPAPIGATLTVTCQQTNALAVMSGGWTAALPAPGPPPPPPPPTAKAIYGVHGDWNFFGSNAYVTNAVKNMNTLGCKLMRTSLLWDKLQSTSGGTINWTTPDTVVNGCLGAGIQPLFYIGGTPGFANSNLGRWGVPTGGAAISAWETAHAAFWTKAAQRYGAVGNVKVPYWEIWNEPNQSYTGSYWMPNGVIATPDVNTYGTLATTIYNAIKAVNPALKVGIGSPTNLNMNDGNSHCVPGISWITSLMTNGVPCDAITAHPYPTGGSADPSVDNFPGGNSFKDIGRLQTAMVANGYGSKELWITEWLDTTASGNETTKATYTSHGLNLIESTYSVAVTGATGAGVTLSNFFSLMQGVSGNSVGLFDFVNQNGPNVELAAGSTFAAFLATNPS